MNDRRDDDEQPDDERPKVDVTYRNVRSAPTGGEMCEMNVTDTPAKRLQRLVNDE
jgi:hypothetical protein